MNYGLWLLESSKRGDEKKDIGFVFPVTNYRFEPVWEGKKSNRTEINLFKPIFDSVQKSFLKKFGLVVYFDLKPDRTGNAQPYPSFFWMNLHFFKRRGSEIAGHFQATEDEFPAFSASHNLLSQFVGENRRSVMH